MLVFLQAEEVSKDVPLDGEDSQRFDRWVAQCWCAEYVVQLAYQT